MEIHLTGKSRSSKTTLLWLIAVAMTTMTIVKIKDKIKNNYDWSNFLLIALHRAATTGEIAIAALFQNDIR